MAKKKRVSFGERLSHVVSDFADAASVAATGSQIGVLELAAEEEFRSPAAKRPRKSRAASRKKTAPKKKAVRKKKKAVSKKASKPKKKKRAAKRR